MHSVDGVFFVETLVVFAHVHAENDRRHVFEAMNPFLPLRPLASDVKQLEIEVFEGERNLRQRARKTVVAPGCIKEAFFISSVSAWDTHFHDAGRFDSRMQNVLFRRQVIFAPDPVQFVEEILGAIEYLKLVRSAKGKFLVCIIIDHLQGRKGE